MRFKATRKWLIPQMLKTLTRLFIYLFMFLFWFLSAKFPVLPPNVHTSVNQVTKEKNQDALLTCTGENTPNRSTVISWIFNGTSLPLDLENDVHHLSDFVYFEEEFISKVNFSLLIRNVTERDTGAYSCKVLTLKGDDSDTIFLSLVKPSE